MKLLDRSILLMVPLLGLSQPLVAQTPVGTAPAARKSDADQGMTLYESFDGSSNSDGQVLGWTSTAGYAFNPHFRAELGIPVIYVHGTTSTGTVSSTGLGNVFGDLRLLFRNPILNYGSTFVVAAPTGDTSRGRSTGRITFDWNNQFARGFGRWTPFANAGVGNSLFG